MGVEKIELSSVLHVEPMQPTAAPSAMQGQSLRNAGEEKSRRKAIAKPMPGPATSKDPLGEESGIEEDSPPHRLDSLA